MRILIISSEFPPGPGGIGTHAYHITKELQRSGCTVLVMTPQDYVDDCEIKRFNDLQPFKIIRLNHLNNTCFKGISRFSQVFHKIGNWSPDVVLTTGERSAWILSWMSIFKHIHWIAVGHGSEFGGPVNPNTKLTRWAFNRADAVICVSQYTQSVMHNMGINGKMERVIPNGADDEVFQMVSVTCKPFVLQEIGIQEQSNILLTVGNVTGRKGQEVVIRAMPIILNEYPNTEYLIAGLPTEKRRLVDLAKELGVFKHVHFLGRRTVEQLFQLYHTCNIFLMTSRKLSDGDFEGFGISVIEAALCGKPAIVSKGSGLEEAVIDRVTGLCVPENDSEETAKAVIYLFKNPEEIIKMGNSAQKRANEGFTWKIVGQKYFNFLQEFVNKQIRNI